MFAAFGHQLFLIPILVCGLIAAAIALERLYYLFIRASSSSEKVFKEVQRRVLAEDLSGALQYACSEPQAAVPRTFRELLIQADQHYQQHVELLDVVVLDLQAALQPRIAYIASIANIVTLIGLLGTIVGLIQSFAAVSDANPAEKQMLLAQGISTAMYATAGGISIAIPCLIMHAILEQRAHRLLDDAERYGLRLARLLDARHRREPPLAAAE